MLTYSGALAPGDFARIGDVEGIVTGVGVLSTKVKTKRNEEVIIPNAVVISGTTTNYTTYAEEGVYAATVLTIGYDTPWRQVEGLLNEAAARTPGLQAERKPIVLQTNLSDFYVEYTFLVCMAHPVQRPVILTALHARIQDVFNEYGVQIMSPHYERDPEQPKIVSRDQWHSAPDAAEPEPDQPPPRGVR
jgi:small-conductance mechanosensitive channel